MLTVYGRATSSNVQAVMWGIAELGLTCNRLDYGHVHGGLDSPAFRAMSPHGLVPVIKDDDVVVWESCAILRYLAARHGDGGAFWPADPVERAKVDMWAEWAKTSLCASFTTPVFWPRVRMSERERDAAALRRAVDAFDALLAVLEKQIADHAFVCGDALSLADIVAGHLLFRYFDIDIARAERPGLAAYYARLTSRAAYRTHVMVDYAPLRHPDAN